MLAIVEFDLGYEWGKAVKAWVLAALLVEHGGTLEPYSSQSPGCYSSMGPFVCRVVGLV